jgi:hypothetical protein
MNFVKYKKLTLFLMVLFLAGSLSTVSAAQYTWTQTSLTNPTYDDSCFVDAGWDYETNYPANIRIMHYDIFKEVKVGDDFTIILPKKEKAEYKLKNGKITKNDITVKLHFGVQNYVRNRILSNLSTNEVTIDGKDYYAYHFHANAPSIDSMGPYRAYLDFSPIPVNDYQEEISQITYGVKIV